MAISAPYGVVYDLEFTAWDGSMARRWMAPGEFREVIQIGAVKVDRDFAPLESLNLLIRPRLNTNLSSFIEKLTGITNADLAAQGIDFAEAFSHFAAFAGTLPVVSFGRDDLVLRDNIRLYGLKDLPPMPHCIDIRYWLMENGIDVRGLHACDVGPAAGVAFEGQTHDGLCDALSVAAGIQALIGRGAKPPQPDIKPLYP
jgi:DNA polymerase III, epsilon subunit and related 3''-5'' exonucleases